MSLVGNIIMQLRRRIPDAPQAFTQTGTPPITPVSDPNGQFGPGPVYYFKISFASDFGETNATPEIGPISLSSGQNAFQISLVSVQSPTTGNRTMKVYMGIYPGGETTFFPIPLIAGVAVYTLTGAPPQVAQPGMPPTRTTYFFPDSDGNFIGAQTAYDLLNEATGEMVKICGGIVDVTGVQSQINQSMYRLDSPFYQFINAWYDGYPMDVVPRSFMYLRNSAAGFSGILSYEQDGPQSSIQVWPQSNRTGGQNFLEAPLSATANSCLVSDGSGFLSIGLAQIDDEIVVYSQITAGGTVFSGVLRGMGGTDAVAHNRFAPVTELNIRMSGYRLAKTYSVGDSEQVIQVPQAWERSLVLHMLSQVRSMEQDDQQANQLMQAFVADAEKIAKGSRLGRMKPRQIPIWGQNTSDARNVNGIGFGWLIN